MSRAIAIAALAGALVPGAAWAQGVDFVHQDVVVDLTGETLHIEVGLHVVAEDEADALAFLDPGLPLTSMEVDGAAVSVEPDLTYPGYVSWAYWPSPLEAGDEATLTMTLDGEPDCETRQGAVCRRTGDEVILFAGMPDMTWHFLSLFGSDPFTASLTVHAPAELTVIAGQGAAQGVVDEADGTKTWTYGAERPVEELGVYARAVDVVWAEDGPPDAPPVAGYFEDRDDRRATMQHMVDLGAQVLAIDGEMYGPLGLDEVHLLTFSEVTPFGGMGLYGNVFLQEFVFDDRFAYIRDQGVAHELSHSWWAGVANAASPAEGGFFAEAFAEYSAWRALGRLQGPQVRTSGVRMNSVWYMLRRPGDDDVAVLDPEVTTSPVYVFATYHKASSILRTLEQAVGEEGFGAALVDFLARGRGGLSVDGLVEDILAQTGHDVSADLEQWLYTTGYPTLEVATQPSAGGLTIEVSTEDDFSFGLPIVAHLDDGTTVEQVLAVTPGSHQTELSLPGVPLLVEVDPDWTVVRRVVPSVEGDVTFDGLVDAADLIEVALRQGGYLPTERRVDGRYDPLYDLNDDEHIDRDDLAVIAP